MCSLNSSIFPFRGVHDNKNLEGFGLVDSYTSFSNEDVGSQPSTTGLNTGHSCSKRYLHHVNPVEIRPFLLRENRKHKTKVTALSADTEVKVALEVE